MSFYAQSAKIFTTAYFLGKLIVAVGMGALSWAFFTNKFSSVSELNAPALNYYWFMVVVSAAYFSIET